MLKYKCQLIYRNNPDPLMLWFALGQLVKFTDVSVPGERLETYTILTVELKHHQMQFVVQTIFKIFKSPNATGDEHSTNASEKWATNAPEYSNIFSFHPISVFSEYNQLLYSSNRSVYSVSITNCYILPSHQCIL